MGLADAAFARAPDALRLKWRQAWTEVGKRVNYGVRPYEREWDVLLVLDACRWDLWAEYAPDHDVHDAFRSSEPVYSCASSSDEWLIKAFDEADDDLVADTVYVTANAYTHQIDLDRFHHVEEVWKYARDPQSGTVRPEAVTNEAIRAHREHPDRRLVVHYLQPHAPFLHCLGQYMRGDDNQAVWQGVREDWYDPDQVRRDYGRNLLAVLDHVETVLEDVEGTVAVTSDHGNLVGEWGLYGHPSWVPLPALKRVPWATADGEGAGAYEVRDREAVTTVETEEPSVKDHLRQLGYVE